MSCCALLAACAGLDAVNVHSIDSKGAELDNSGAAVMGFRYYDTAPFLFVHSDGKGGVTGEVVWLPDMSVKRSIRPYAYLSSNDATIKFTNGTLSEASANVDETVIPDAIVKALTSIAQAGIVTAEARADQGKCPKLTSPPYLYRISIQGDTISLSGGPPCQQADAQAAMPPPLPTPTPGKN